MRPYAYLSIWTLILWCNDISSRYFRVSSCPFLCLGRLFIAWGPNFRGSVKLDGKKFTALLALNSNWNLSFHSIINVGKKKKKNNIIASRIQNCLLNSMNLIIKNYYSLIKGNQNKFTFAVNLSFKCIYCLHWFNRLIKKHCITILCIYFLICRKLYLSIIGFPCSTIYNTDCNTKYSLCNLFYVLKYIFVRRGQ